MLLACIAVFGMMAAHADAAYISPLKQIADGVAPADVTCRDGRELVLRQSSGMPVCLEPDSVERLIASGWAIHIIPDYTDGNTNSEIFSLGAHLTESERVQYSENATGYLARPADDGSYPGIIMIHEWWGLNENIRVMADKLASHGYSVLAVDLYGGEVAGTSEQARALIGSYDSQQGLQNMNAARAFLTENHSAEKMASIGWCFGGGQSLRLALGSGNMDATVIYYGSLVTDAEALSSIQWPVLGVFAELDRGITTETVNAFESSLNELGIQNEIITYAGVNHAFANPSGQQYAPEESRDAWNRTIDFLESSMG